MVVKTKRRDRQGRERERSVRWLEKKVSHRSTSSQINWVGGMLPRWGFCLLVWKLTWWRANKRAATGSSRALLSLCIGNLLLKTCITSQIASTIAFDRDNNTYEWSWRLRSLCLGASTRAEDKTGRSEQSRAMTWIVTIRTHQLFPLFYLISLV